MIKTFVLDACALVAILKDENGADIVADAYRKAEKSEAEIIMNRATTQGRTGRIWNPPLQKVGLFIF